MYKLFSLITFTLLFINDGLTKEFEKSPAHPNVEDFQTVNRNSTPSIEALSRTEIIGKIVENTKEYDKVTSDIFSYLLIRSKYEASAALIPDKVISFRIAVINRMDTKISQSDSKDKIEEAIRYFLRAPTVTQEDLINIYGDARKKVYCEKKLLFWLQDTGTIDIDLDQRFLLEGEELFKRMSKLRGLLHELFSKDITAGCHFSKERYGLEFPEMLMPDNPLHVHYAQEFCRAIYVMCMKKNNQLLEQTFLLSEMLNRDEKLRAVIDLNLKFKEILVCFDEKLATSVLSPIQTIRSVVKYLQAEGRPKGFEILVDVHPSTREPVQSETVGEEKKEEPASPGIKEEEVVDGIPVDQSQEVTEKSGKRRRNRKVHASSSLVLTEITDTLRLLNEAKAALEEAKKSNEMLGQELNRDKDRAKSHETYKEQTQSTIKKLRAEDKKKQSTMDSLSAENARLQRDIETRTTDFKKVSKERKELFEVAGTLKQADEKTKADKEKIEARLKTFEIKCQELTVQLNRLEGEKQKNLEEISRLKAITTPPSTVSEEEFARVKAEFEILKVSQTDALAKIASLNDLQARLDTATTRAKALEELKDDIEKLVGEKNHETSLLVTERDGALISVNYWKQTAQTTQQRVLSAQRFLLPIGNGQTLDIDYEQLMSFAAFGFRAQQAQREKRDDRKH